MPDFPCHSLRGDDGRVGGGEGEVEEEGFLLHGRPWCLWRTVRGGRSSEGDWRRKEVGDPAQFDVFDGFARQGGEDVGGFEVGVGGAFADPFLSAVGSAVRWSFSIKAKGGMSREAAMPKKVSKPREVGVLARGLVWSTAIRVRVAHRVSVVVQSMPRCHLPRAAVW